MKATFFSFFLVLILICCKKEPHPYTNHWEKISERLQYRENGKTFFVHSGKFSYEIPTSKLPFKKVVLLNASLVGYFTELGAENYISGISSPEYIYSEKILQRIRSGKIQNVGNEQKYDGEKIISLKPDAVFTNYIATFENTYELLRKNSIEVLFLDEYLEENPLEKSKYLLLFGKLFNLEQTSLTTFKKIEKSYDSLQQLAASTAQKPTVLANEMYGSQWFLPGGKTALAHFIKDAGGLYINASDQSESAKALSFEEVFVKGKNADFWVNAGNHQHKNELLQINPNYAHFKAFQFGNIYGVNAQEKGKGNDFFESGVVRADLVLGDYIKIFHPELLQNRPLIYLKKLK